MCGLPLLPLVGLVDRRIGLPRAKVRSDVLKALRLRLAIRQIRQAAHVRLHDDFVALEEPRIDVIRLVTEDVQTRSGNLARIQSVLQLSWPNHILSLGIEWSIDRDHIRA
jgi:hypothetical protein